MADQQHLDWRTIRSRTGGFPPEALLFVRDGLAHTVTMARREEAPLAGAHPESGDARPSHVTGQELCLGLRDLAVERYGMLARTVLGRWGIRSTKDFGRIVYAMIDLGLLRKSDDDSPEDFHGVYDFDEAFGSDTLN